MTIARAVRSVGPLAALIECGTGEAAALVVAADRVGVSVGADGVLELVPAATTVLVECTDRSSLARAVEVLRSIEPAERDGPTEGGSVVDLPVTFDGADLVEVGERSGLGVAGVITAIVDRPLRVAFCGFAPGFAYLDGLSPELHLPRRDAPRARVPERSFAVAAGYAAVYPDASPGGWHLLGSTELDVWVTDREPPSLLAPGTIVRVVEAGRA